MIGTVITKIIKNIKFSAFFLGLDVGRKVERAKIVAWLADIGLEIAADEIKAGEHLK